MPPPSPRGTPPPYGSPLNDLTVRLIAESELFHGLPDQPLLEAASAARARDAENGQILFRQGEPVGDFGLLARGRLKLSRVAAGGPAGFIQLIGPGEACDWPGVLSDDLHSSTAVAAEPARVLFWPRPFLSGLFDRHPVLYRNALRILWRRQKDLADRHRELMALRAPQRLARALLRLASLSGRWDQAGGLSEIPLSRRDLAQLTGTTLFTVSRLLTEWQGGGVIEAGQERVRVEKPDALALIVRLPGP